MRWVLLVGLVCLRGSAASAEQGSVYWGAPPAGPSSAAVAPANLHAPRPIEPLLRLEAPQAPAAMSTPGASTQPEPVPRPIAPIEQTDSPGSAPAGWPLEAEVNELPLADVSRSWWTRAWAWMPRDQWNNSIQLGINGTEGNSQTFSFQTGADLKRKTDRYNFTADLDYQKTQAAGVETQNNAFFGTHFDRMLDDSPWSAFTKLGLEYDRFKAFDLRLNTNAGLGYHWLREPSSSLVTRFGAGASREFGGPEESWVPEALLGIEAEQQLTDRQKASAKIEYLPQWDALSDYRMVTELGWEILLNEEETFSLKMAATNRFDSTPQGRRPNDVNYSLLLLYKF